MSGRPRYVVRYTGIDSWSISPPTSDPHWTPERIAKVIEDEKANKGKFVKVGGGITEHISEAQVIGWSSHKRWAHVEYELVPVKIVPASDSEAS